MDSDTSTSVSAIVGDASALGDIPEPVFPNVGDTFGDFHLVAELGRGGQGCVFLATQRFLGDRPVVLKISACDGLEHLSLARLQHTHIVPLYFAEDDRRRNLRLLCMPYFGSATLKHVLDLLRTVPVAQRTGQNILDAIGKCQQTVPVTLPASGPARQIIARASYLQAICWIGACLAEALHYAHERGLVHLDIKPSNVLLAVDGQPMLLDFHLAQAPIRPDVTPPEWLGGSPLYMSPEHKATLNAVRKDEPVPTTVDGRADIFALGALLYEALGGTLPFRHDSSPCLRKINPQVSAGLSDIVHKCLAHSVGERYQTAGALAADLQRHLTNQPLKGVPNRDLSERWTKWRRRRPYALAVIGLAVAVVVATAGLVYFRENNLARLHDQLHSLLETGSEQLRQGRCDDATTTARHGLVLAAGLSGTDELAAGLARMLKQAERLAISRDLTMLVDRLRFGFGMDSLPVAELKTLESRCRLFWDNRQMILERLSGEGFETSSTAATDLLDLALLWTDIRIRLAPAGDEASAREETMRALEEAKTLFGPSIVLWQRIRAHADAIGAEMTETELPPARTAWEHYALGRIFWQAGDLDRAATSFRAACTIQPQGFWPNFYAGLCAYKQKNYLDAATAFSVCIGADSNRAVCFFNRGLAWSALEHDDQALQDYDRAFQLDPKLSAAVLNRGLLHYRKQRFSEAVSDLRRALELGADPVGTHYNLALAHFAQSDYSQALECAREALRHDPAHAEARQLLQNIQRITQKK